MLLETLKANDDEQLAFIENSVRSTKPRQWRKSADKPLGEVLLDACYQSVQRAHELFAAPGHKPPFGAEKSIVLRFDSSAFASALSS